MIIMHEKLYLLSFGFFIANIYIAEWLTVDQTHFGLFDNANEACTLAIYLLILQPMQSNNNNRVIC